MEYGTRIGVNIKCGEKRREMIEQYCKIIIFPGSILMFWLLEQQTIYRPATYVFLFYFEHVREC